MAGLGAITPVGWVVIAIGAAVVGGSIAYSKAKSRGTVEKRRKSTTPRRKKGKGAKQASAGET